MKTSELTGAQLDWAVAKCEGINLHHAIQPHGYLEILFNEANGGDVFTPSDDWSQGGPIIEREKIDLQCWDFHSRPWKALIDGGTDAGIALYQEYGPTPLIAAMRCYVASKLGDDVEIPKELT
jgi:hypothetical protein